MLHKELHYLLVRCPYHKQSMAKRCPHNGQVPPEYYTGTEHYWSVMSQ
jgi:hypothetical protein